MSTITCDFSSLDGLSVKLNNVMYKYPEEVNKFMKNQMMGFKNAIKTKQDPRWQNKITHSKYAVNPWQPFDKLRYVCYSDKVTPGINTWAILNEREFYERFVNDGHEIRRKKRGPSVGTVKGTHHIESGFKEYAPQVAKAADELAERLATI